MQDVDRLGLDEGQGSGQGGGTEDARGGTRTLGAPERTGCGVKCWIGGAWRACGRGSTSTSAHANYTRLTEPPEAVGLRSVGA